MLFPFPVKERLAHVIGKYFTTKEIVNVFGAANVAADVSLYAKWRITLNAFEKLSEPDEAIPHFLEGFLEKHRQQIRELWIPSFSRYTGRISSR